MNQRPSAPRPLPFALCAAPALLAACAGLPTRTLPRPPEVSFRLRAWTLASGLRVIAEEEHAAPVAGVYALYGSGSSADPAGKEGWPTSPSTSPFGPSTPRLAR